MFIIAIFITITAIVYFHLCIIIIDALQYLYNNCFLPLLKTSTLCQIISTFCRPLTYPSSVTSKPRVFSCSCDKTPSSSLTYLGPSLILYLLHCPTTDSSGLFASLHTPRKSTPLSFGPPQALTSKPYSFSVRTVTSSKFLPTVVGLSLLVVNDWHSDSVWHMTAPTE